MQTLVAYAGVSSMAQPEVEAATGRVQEYYAGLWQQPPSFHEVRAETAGLLLWDATNTPSLWPAWSQTPQVTVASVYAPIGCQRIVGSAALEDSPGLLAQALVTAPHKMFDLGAPFVLATTDARQRTLDLFTDALGVGRLFEVRVPGGWVWSNRPVAALRFAGIEASADQGGWVHSAVADEFFGSATPYTGVRAIDGATHIHWDGRSRKRRVSVIDTTPTWAGTVTSAAGMVGLIEEAADGLRQAAQSIGRLYKGTPVVDLSGGRDSRLVAATFMASGTDFILNSHDGVPGDLVTASRLVDVLTSPVEHRIRHHETGGKVTVTPLVALSSARRWHAYAEGMRPCSFVAHPAPNCLDSYNGVVIGGVGGEIAHGFFYPGDLAKLEDLPLEEKLRQFARRIVARQAPVSGASAASRLAVEEQIAGVLQGIASWGVTDATVLDHYYLRERLRRWGATGERIGTVSPLLNTSFMVAALALAPAQRKANILHRQIIRELVPQWADVPFFPSETKATTASPVSAPVPPRILRLADAVDQEEIGWLLADTQAWAGAFDARRVHDLWHRSASGETTARDEAVLRRALWRGAFEDHLADVNESTRPVHPPVSVPSPSPWVAGLRPASTSLKPSFASQVRRNTTVKQFGQSAFWAATRDQPIGKAIRKALK